MPTDNKISSSSRGPSAVVVINNYNYGRFLRDAVGSALAQTYANTRVVVIDDGSTDESHEVLSELQSQHPEIEIHYKSNGGQLSCFNAAVPYIKDAGWVFLLDADDHFPANYVEQMLDAAEPNIAMLLAKNVNYDTRIGQHPLLDCRINELAPIDIPQSAHIVARLRPWLGRPTSALAIRSALYRLIFPYFPEEDWRISADQVVTRGASIAGGFKRFMPSIGINYRVHGNNNWHGTNKREDAPLQRKKTLKLTAVLMKQAGLHYGRYWPLGIRVMMRELSAVPEHHRRALKLPSSVHIQWWPVFWPVKKCKALLSHVYRQLMRRYTWMRPLDGLIRSRLSS